ncbi:MAG: ABC transporter permease [Patescibacteria group bacterium]|nr:ABC transporter permease [Patescibacteria group bacterium]
MKSRNLKYLLLTTYANFKRNKIRTLLTSLGITIGVMSVVLLNALGLGLKNFLKKQFESLGSNLIMVMPGNAFNDEEGIGNTFGPGLIGGVSFDEKDYQLLKKIPEADYTVPIFFKSITLEYNGKKQLGYVEGANQDIFPVMNLIPISGRFYTKSDLQKKSKVAVLGFVATEKLFDSPEQALGKTIKINTQRFRVIGVIEKKGDREIDNSAIVPYRSTFGNLNPDKTFFSIYLGVDDEDNISIVKEKAKNILKKKYDEEEFSVTEQTEILNTVNQIFAMLNGVLVAIGSISLIVGGIGIMNIMYSTVTERTKEIGIRRATGATENDILFQFLSESVILSIFGGIMGLTISALIVLGIRSVFPAAINLLSVMLAVGVSTLIGVFFGVFPAKRAAKLTPLEAIRYE